MKISVLLEALTGSFDTDIDKSASKAERRLNKMAAEFDKRFKIVAGVVATAGVAIAAFTKRQIDSADRLERLAQSTGIAVEELSGLQLAAELSDVAIEDLATSLSKLSKNAVAAAEGGKVSEAFTQLGVAVRDASGAIRPLDDLLGDVAEAFAGIEDGAAKSALAQEIFGKAAAGLIPFLNLGRAGLKEAREEAERLGIVISTETAKAADEFNDNLTRLQSRLRGIALDIAEPLLPVLVEYTGSLVEASKKSDDLAKLGLKVAYAFAVVAESVAFVATTFRAVVGSFEAVAADLDVAYTFITTGGAKAAEGGNPELAKALENRNRIVAESNERYRNLWNDNFTELSDSLKLELDALEAGLGPDLTQSIENAIGFVEEQPFVLRPEFRVEPKEVDVQVPFRPGFDARSPAPKRQLTPTDESADDAAKRIEEQLRRETEALESAEETARRVYDARRALINDNVKDEELRVILIDKANRKFAEDMEKIGEEMATDYEETTDLMTEFGREAARNMQDAFADFLFDPFSEGLDGMLQGFAQMLQKLAAQKLAAKIFDSIGEWGKNNSGSFFGSIASFFGGSGAGGVETFANRPYMVGEKEPEIFVPRTSGTVIPLSQMRGERAVNQTFNISTPDADSFRLSERQIRRRGRLGLQI